ncbi:putative secreted protein [Rhodopirellula sallentina SM41]|uniref:Putative secreted protein n=1 Tax=Rhodopirellula sallentina SM41 TaxID=1263870 RepID=M5UAF7_9BACT|nr:putative secreted protein [Rhodopirellula sallentina SM41]
MLWRASATALMVCIVSVLAIPMASAESPSELLEKGIYTEETVGDLAEAIRVYKQVVTEGKESRTAAAHAQYRIGLCYEKQGETKKATDAFQAVVDEYPTEKELVAQAKSHLPSELQLLPAPWGEGDELIFEMKLQTGLGVGMQVFRIAKSKLDERDVWECQNWQIVTINGQRGKSRVFADANTFAPIQSTWKHTMLGKASAEYRDGEVRIQLANKNEPVVLKSDGSWFDNEQAAEVFRRMPLEENYQTKIRVISSLGAAEIPIGLEVTKLESITVPAGTFECFQLKLEIGQTFWISNDEHRYIVRFEAGGVTADLTEIRNSQESIQTTVERERFSVKLPANWYAYTPNSPDQNDDPSTQIIDPNASMDARIEGGPLKKLQAKHGTVRQWLEASLAEYEKRISTFKIGGEGIQTVRVGDREGVSAVFEYVENNKAKKARRVAVFGDESAVNLRFTADADIFETLQPSCEQILANLNLK